MGRVGGRRKNCGAGARREGLERLTACAAAPSPLVGEGGSPPRSDGDRGEGLLSLRGERPRRPCFAFRAPSPTRGEGKKAVQRMTALAALIQRDIRIALRVGGGALIGVLFFLTVVVLMPFAVVPDLALLRRLGPAILWLGALLASLLTLDRLFMADHDDGSPHLLIMGRTPPGLTRPAKAPPPRLAAGCPP